MIYSLELLAVIRPVQLWFIFCSSNLFVCVAWQQYYNTEQHSELQLQDTQFC